MTELHSLVINGKGYVAVVAPSVAVSVIGPAVHRQAMARVKELFRLPIKEGASVWDGASPEQRAAEINHAMTDPECAAVLAVAGGNDSIRLLRHLDPEALAGSAVPFIGYSDNTAIHNFLWRLGKRSFYGGSTQVQVGPGPGMDPEHVASLGAAVAGRGAIELSAPAAYEVRGVEWQNPRALDSYGNRVEFPPYVWEGARRAVRGRTWGGCLQTLVQLAVMGQLPEPSELAGAVMFLELSDEPLGDGNVCKLVRALGEAGYFDAVAALALALPPHSVTGPGGQVSPDPAKAHALLAEMSEQVGAYNPDLTRVLGLPIGHQRPQYVIPYGGELLIDARRREVTAFYGDGPAGQ